MNAIRRRLSYKGFLWSLGDTNTHIRRAVEYGSVVAAVGGESVPYRQDAVFALPEYAESSRDGQLLKPVPTSVAPFKLPRENSLRGAIWRLMRDKPLWWTARALEIELGGQFKRKRVTNVLRYFFECAVLERRGKRYSREFRILPPEEIEKRLSPTAFEVPEAPVLTTAGGVSFTPQAWKEVGKLKSLSLEDEIAGLRERLAALEDRKAKEDFVKALRDGRNQVCIRGSLSSLLAVEILDSSGNGLFAQNISGDALKDFLIVHYQRQALVPAAP